MSTLETGEVPEGVEVSVEYRHIEVHKLSFKFPSRISGLPISLYLGEAVVNPPGKAFLPFVAKLETKPNFIAFRIGGRLYLEGDSQKIERWILPRGDDPPKVWYWIYRDVLKVVSRFVKFLDDLFPETLKMT